MRSGTVHSAPLPSSTMTGAPPLLFGPLQARFESLPACCGVPPGGDTQWSLSYSGASMGNLGPSWKHVIGRPITLSPVLSAPKDLSERDGFARGDDTGKSRSLLRLARHAVASRSTDFTGPSGCLLGTVSVPSLGHKDCDSSDCEPHRERVYSEPYGPHICRPLVAEAGFSVPRRFPVRTD